MKKTTIGLIIVSLLDVLVIAVGWYAYTSTLDIRKEALVARNALGEEKARLARVSELQQTLTTSKDLRGRLNAYMYEGTDEGALRFVKAVENLAKVSGTDLHVGSAAYADRDGSPPFMMDIVVEGDFRDVHQFLRLLETFPSSVSFSEFIVEQTEKQSPTSSLWKASIKIALHGIHSTPKAMEILP